VIANLFQTPEIRFLINDTHQFQSIWRNYKQQDASDIDAGFVYYLALTTMENICLLPTINIYTGIKEA